MTDRVDLDKLRKLAKAATPGPWQSFDEEGECYSTAPATGAFLVEYGASVDQRMKDVHFIAAANPAVVLELLDRLAQVEALHRRYGIFELDDSCPDTSDEHREEHHHACADEPSEFYCDQMPVGAVCDECHTEDGERVDWPCATVRSLTGEDRRE